ncbi:hypothetical protein PSTG_18360, partial [Puccinia striiformis f. sp. tritici PST-78]
DPGVRRKPSRFEKVDSFTKVPCVAIHPILRKGHFISPNSSTYLKISATSFHNMECHMKRATVDKCGQCRDDLLPGAISLIVISKTYHPTH